MKVLLGTFLFSVLSALVPAFNAEAWVALASQTHSVVLVSAVAAVGQMAGKLLWYYAGANADRLRWIHARLERPKARASREKWQERTHGRPWFTAWLLFLSAALGIPPYAVMAALAGLLRVNLAVFLVTGLVGRFLRFLGVGAGAASLLGWLF